MFDHDPPEDRPPAPTGRPRPTPTPLSATLTCALLAVLLLVAPASATAHPGAGSAPGKPVVTNVALSADTLDVRERGRPITLTVEAQESVEPVHDITLVRAELLSPSLSFRHPARYVWTTLALTDGTATDGTWSGTATIPRWTIPGEWTVGYLLLEDSGGGVSTLYGSSPDDWEPDWQRTFTVQSVADITRPTLTAFTFSPREVDTRRRIRTVQIRARAADTESGVGDVYVNFESVTTTATSRTTIGHSTHLTRSGRWWKGVLRVPMWAGQGRHAWHPYVRVFDRATNSRTVTTKQLRARGAPTSLFVTSRTDRDRPRVTGLTRTPGTVDVSAADARISFTVAAADRSSGAQALRVTATSPSGTVAKRKLVRAAGPRRATSFSGTLRIPVGAEAGEWTVHLLVTDLVGHRRSYTTGQLREHGFPATVTVTSG